MNKKKIEQATEQFMRNECEKTDAILDSVGAIHGETAKEAVSDAFELCVSFVSMSEVFCNTSPLPEAFVKDMIADMREALDIVTRSMFHLVVGKGIPVCEQGNCQCNPEALELKKMLDALVLAHIEEKEKCGALIEAELKK